MSDLVMLQQLMLAAICTGDTEEAKSYIVGHLDAYLHSYRARMTETLRMTHPNWVTLLGPVAFDLYASDYLTACPPASGHTLQHWANEFPRHLVQACSIDSFPAALATLALSHDVPSGALPHEYR